MCVEGAKFHRNYDIVNLLHFLSDFVNSKVFYTSTQFVCRPLFNLENPRAYFPLIPTSLLLTVPALRLPHLYEGHVHLVHVRPLLSVHLDTDKALVEESPDILALKRLSLHHVTPVTGGVAH